MVSFGTEKSDEFFSELFSHDKTITVTKKQYMTMKKAKNTQKNLFEPQAKSVFDLTFPELLLSKIIQTIRM